MWISIVRHNWGHILVSVLLYAIVTTSDQRLIVFLLVISTIYHQCHQPTPTHTQSLNELG